MGRVLGLDVGEKRVGLAISDPTGTVARPFATLRPHPRADHFSAIEAVVKEQAVELVIVGQPLSLDGTVGPQARLVARYAEALDDRLNVPVRLWDERYSTSVAEDIIRLGDGHGHGRRRGGGSKRDQASIDAVAACVILQSFLDAQRRDRPADELLSTCPEDREPSARSDTRDGTIADEESWERHDVGTHRIEAI